jgi:hypothetical protein
VVEFAQGDKLLTVSSTESAKGGTAKVAKTAKDVPREKHPVAAFACFAVPFEAGEIRDVAGWFAYHAALLNGFKDLCRCNDMD